MNDIALRRADFRELHTSGCFIMPNPWDVGSARYLASLGFRALATTSAGFGFSQGLPDSVLALPREGVLRHVAEIAGAVDLPVNADFQSGYAQTPDGVAESVRRCIDAGAAGLSIEDATGSPDAPLYELPEALDRLAAARAAITASGTGTVLTARAECFLVGHDDPLRESIRRLQAYAVAGADVLFAPGVRSAEDIRTLVKSVSPRPVNVLIGTSAGPHHKELAEMGVRRISVGSALARAAWAGFMRAVRPIAERGSFEGLDGLVPFAELNALFEKSDPER